MLLHTKNKGLMNFKKIDSPHESETNPRVEKKKTETVPDYKSLLSEFDDYVANARIGSGVSRSFEMGDLVWGKVKSHPWWPGRVFNEAFVSPSVRNLKTNGYVLVAFFGDNSYNWFDPAHLLPFEPHVSEKSHQTNSITFVKAVEEALEEICKRSGLGLTCKCLNPFNFRRSNVQGYFVVDVPGYEVQAVYSSKQIKKARESFSCLKTLAFVKRCALGLQGFNSESVEFLKKKAAVLAFRKAVFEEFDETYEQAFKAKSAYSLVKMQEPFTRAPSQALLSGSLVTAETLRDLESYATAMKVKDSTTQDKRREEADDMTVHSGQAKAKLQGIDESLAGDHVLQRRTQYLKIPSGDTPGKESSVSKLSRFDDDKGLAQESKVRMGEKGVLFPEHLKQDETGMHFRSTKGSLQGKSAAGVGIKKVNVLKRSSSSEMNYANGPKKKLKKKKEPKSELNRVNPDKRKPLTFVEAWDKKSSQLDAAERHSNMLTARNSKHDVRLLLSSLQSLSLDPFFGSSDRSSIKSVRQFFLRFRSFANQNSSLAKPPSTTKPSKPLSSNNEPSKPERKRLSSDHQQDIPSTKKLKKTIQLIKPITSDKKTNQEVKKSSNLAPLNHPVRDQDGPGPGPVPINAKAQPRKKMSPSKKVMEPTMLVMKFPYGTSLPSTALLKARFGRFGPLDQSAIRVFWKSSICRVVFLYKLDAQTAIRYASGSNSFFGNVNVTYFLRDVKAYSAPGDHEPKKAKTGKPMAEPLSQRLERRQPNIQLKSCLKKPGDNGNGNRGKARVRFMLDGKETETTFRASGKNNGSSSSSCVAMEFISKNTQNITVPSTLPLILPLSSQNSKNQVDQVEPPLDQSKCTVDISEEMMKLLLRCNDVMANFTGLLGNVPYHLL